MENITVLFPGAFKPMHAGHINLINRYCVDSSVNEVKVFIGASSRGDIDQETALNVAQILLSENKKVKIQTCSDPTPITTAYKYIGVCNPGIYVLAASSKEPENAKRIKKFVENHNSGKYPLAEDVKVIEMSINIEPLNYIGRTDDNNGKPISASILRQDITNENFDNFKTNYPGCSYNTINTIWNLLKIK